MELTLQTLSDEELRDLYAARQARLQVLKAELQKQPVTAATKYARRLVDRALYTTWLDLEELKGTPAAV